MITGHGPLVFRAGLRSATPPDGCRRPAMVLAGAPRVPVSGA